MTQRGKARLRESLIANLLACRTIRQAARASGISERTALRWLQEGEFKARFEEVKNQMLRTATLKLRASASRAADVLEAVSRDKKAKPGTRAAAANRIIELALSSELQEDVIERIEKLERQGDEIANP